MSKQMNNSPIVMTDRQFKAREQAGTLANGVYPIIQEVVVPTSSTSDGEMGDFAWDNTYFYVCIATNTWKRIAWDTSWTE